MEPQKVKVINVEVSNEFHLFLKELSIYEGLSFKQSIELALALLKAKTKPYAKADKR